jgi:hypothetical protein
MSATVFLDILKPGPRADEIVSRLTDGPNTSTPDKAETGSRQVEVFFLEPETDAGEGRATLKAVLNEIGGDAHEHVAVHYPTPGD